MREVEASRFVAATPEQLDRQLTPETVIAAEGSFTVRDVHESVLGAETIGDGSDANVASDGTIDVASDGTIDVASDGTIDVASDGTIDVASEATTDVVVGGPGIEFTLRFAETADGWYYTKVGEAAPIEHLETWLTVEPENEGSRVTMRSTVAVGLSIPFIDRVAGWKRRGELKRALDTLAADVS